MSDLISRQAAVEAVQDVDTRETVNVSEAVKAINALPSAEKTGRPLIRGSSNGLNGTMYLVCDQCDTPIDPYDKYCRKCGARMVNEDESNS